MGWDTEALHYGGLYSYLSTNSAGHLGWEIFQGSKPVRDLITLQRDFQKNKGKFAIGPFLLYLLKGRRN